jgi:microsomal epoxide hydrolase
MPAEIWQPQIAYFRTQAHVVAFDPRGQGESEIASSGYTAERRARDIGELMERFDEPVVLVGWSLGVLECLQYIDLAGTSRIRALVLVDNSIGEGTPPGGSSTFLKRLRENRRSVTERFVRDMYHEPQSKSYLRRITDAALRVPIDKAVALLRYPYPREHWKEIVYRTDRPLLYVVTPRLAKQAELLAKNRPEAWTRVFPSAGHALFVDDADGFNRLLDQFLHAKGGDQ